VIFRNPLIELIQYEPSTNEVYKRPLLIVPPWINKFYILDLNAEKAFIRWAVAQGMTVFVALDGVEQATGEHEVTAIGYCVGGTLLAATLGYMASVGDDRIGSATFFAALVDFTDVGDLNVFVGAEQLKAVEERMAERGFLEGSHMPTASTCRGRTTSSGPTTSTITSRAKSRCPSTCSSGTRTRRAYPPPTIISTFVIAISKTISRTVGWFSAGGRLT
jgi:hypothetical protein